MAARFRPATKTSGAANNQCNAVIRVRVHPLLYRISPCRVRLCICMHVVYLPVCPLNLAKMLFYFVSLVFFQIPRFFTTPHRFFVLFFNKRAARTPLNWSIILHTALSIRICTVAHRPTFTNLKVYSSHSNWGTRLVSFDPMLKS
jgi:hypothetical protein